LFHNISAFRSVKIT